MSKLESNRWPTAGSREVRAKDQSGSGTWNRNTGKHPLSLVFTPDEKKEKGNK